NATCIQRWAKNAGSPNGLLRISRVSLPDIFHAGRSAIEDDFGGPFQMTTGVLADHRADLPRRQRDAVDPPELVADAGRMPASDEIWCKHTAFKEAGKLGPLQRAVNLGNAGAVQEYGGVGDVRTDRAFPCGVD